MRGCCVPTSEGAGKAENPTQWMVFSSKLVMASGDGRWSGEKKNLLSVSQQMTVGRI